MTWPTHYPQWDVDPDEPADGNPSQRHDPKPLPPKVTRAIVGVLTLIAAFCMWRSQGWLFYLTLALTAVGACLTVMPARRTRPEQ